MRVIGGKFKGRRLVNFQARHLRPTSDRVKETVFNVLALDVSNGRVLDLFSGTGNLSCEAISRGALRATAVERHKTSLRILRENLRTLEIEREVEVVPLDVMKFLKRYEGEAFDVILIDPPFTEKIAHPTLQAVSESRCFGPATKVGVEWSRHERMDQAYGPLFCYSTRRFGDKNVSFFKVSSGERA